MRRRKSRAFLVCGMLLPILAGALIYYLVSPEVWFVRGIDSLLGMHARPAFVGAIPEPVVLVRNYLLDAAWSWSLVFALILILGNNTASLLKAAVLAMILSVVLELLQLTPFAGGTFDPADLLAELLAAATAVVIIYIVILKGGKSRDEENT